MYGLQRNTTHDGNIIWELLCWVYGLKQAPRGFQDHFADVMKLLGFTRLKSDSCVYVHYELLIILFAYVDDLMAFYTQREVFLKVLQELKKHLLLKIVGTLNNEGEKVYFLGRIFERTNTGILIYEDPEYFWKLLREHKLENCTPVSTPGATTQSITADMDDVVDSLRHSLYRRTVGKLQWVIPVR